MSNLTTIVFAAGPECGTLIDESTGTGVNIRVFGDATSVAVVERWNCRPYMFGNDM